MAEIIDFKSRYFDKIKSKYPTCLINEKLTNSEIVVLRLQLNGKDAAEEFKDNISSIMNLQWNIDRPSKENMERKVFSQAWICHHSKRNKQKNSMRNADCTATLKIQIKKVNRFTKRNDPFLTYDPPLNAEVKLNLKHSHSTSTAEALKMLRVEEEVKGDFFAYFSNGLGPAEAIRYHENKFLCEENYLALANSSVNPTQRQVQYLYNVWRQTNLGSFMNPFEKLKEKLDLYKSNGAFVKINENHPWSVIVVTQIMQRLHNLKTSGEIIFVDSTASCESTGTSVTIFLTATNVGALPLAVIIHPYQTCDSYMDAFNMLKKNFPLCFGGKNHPEIFMTDDSSAEKNALKLVWPESTQLLCHFHVAQAEWRWLFSHPQQIPKDERPRLMKLFQTVMYANSEDLLKEAIENIHNEREKYPEFVKRFDNFFKRCNEWLLFHRRHLLTRKNNTNNYAEATIRILKDIILSRTKAFNIVALTDFCISMWEQYLKKKLLEYAHSRKDSVHLVYEQFQKRTEAYSEGDIQMIVPDIYSLKCQGNIYYINVNIGCCTCPSGSSGGFCKHQFFLMRLKNIQFCNAPPITALDRHQLAMIALGEKCPPLPFFNSFKETEIQNLFAETADNCHTLENENSVEIDNEKKKYIASIDEINLIKNELNRLEGLVEGDIDKNTAMRLLRTLKEIKVPDDLNRLYFFKSKVQKKIRVQPTSISRRRPGVTRSGLRIAAGRPSRNTLSKGLKRKRNLKDNINDNLPNAKSHK